ncbi:MAG: TRAP transporter small permease [Cyclobacteriaceae bacterium]|nr:TRAP transporter small permease [Cyclobacteriaceae bacterium SS2]
MKAIRNKIDRGLEVFLSFLMAFMIINVLWQVFSRYVMGQPSSFTDELARYLLIWIGLLGSAYASGKGLHLAMSLFHDKLKDKAKNRLEIILEILIILFAFGFLIVGGVRLVYLTFLLGQISAALELPLGYVYLIIPVSGFFFIFYSVDNILEKISGSKAV